MVSKDTFAFSLNHIVNRYHQTKVIYTVLTDKDDGTYEDLIDTEMINLLISTIAESISGDNWKEVESDINDWLNFQIEPDYYYPEAKKFATMDAYDMYDYLVGGYA